MKKKLLLALGSLLLLSGWFSAFFLTSLSQYSNLYILAPTLLLGAGMGLMHKTVGAKLTALTLAFTALAAILTMNQLFPNHGVSISAFKQRMRDGGQMGHSVPIITQDSDRNGIFASERSLEAFADVEVHLFARLPGPVRMMSFDSTGNLYVTIPQLGAVYQLKDVDHDGYAEQPVLFHVGMDRPHGLVWKNRKLYVAETSQLLELQDTDEDNQVDQVRIILDGLPDDGGH